jgi:hypothetical protein
MIGPDGEEYPDFTDAGVRGGIPDIEGPLFNVKDFDSDIQAAVDAVVEDGSGVVYIPDGIYDLDEGIRVINAGNVVIRGESRDNTILRLNDFTDVPAVIYFRSDRRSDSRRPERVAHAGDTTIFIKDLNSAYAPGDRVIYEGGTNMNIFEVSSVDQNSITVSKPLRTDISPDDLIYGYPAKFKKLVPGEMVGVENLTLETTREMDSHGIEFGYIFNGWVQNVTIRKAGRRPVEFYRSAHIEIRNCLYTATWKSGGGGVGYGGFFLCFDCLMDNVETRDLRHAPDFQDKAQGCVIRNSRFYQSDMQWHTGHPHHNLVENCVIELDDSREGISGASHTCRTSRPELDQVHSAIGPRNVVWYSDFKGYAGNSGADFGYRMDHWNFSYNRIDVEGNDLPFMRIWKDHCDYFVLRGNHFATQNTEQGGGIVFVRQDENTDPGNRHVNLIDNRMYGWPLVDGNWWDGTDGPDSESGNVHSETYRVPPRPDPPLNSDGEPVISLYAWQYKKKFGVDPDTQDATGAGCGPGHSPVIPAGNRYPFSVVKRTELNDSRIAGYITLRGEKFLKKSGIPVLPSGVYILRAGRTGNILTMPLK